MPPGDHSPAALSITLVDNTGPAGRIVTAYRAARRRARAEGCTAFWRGTPQAAEVPV